MIQLSFTFIIWVGCLSGFLICKDVHQAPADVLCLPEQNVTLTCNHSITNYDTILWYQQEHGDTDLKLIGYAYFDTSKNFEKEEYKRDFIMTGDGRSSVSLHIIQTRKLEHRVMYFCAAWGSNREPAYFGGGTKITVLEKGRSAESPKVEILNVSSTEVCNKEAVTLVCLASKFYPDHVSVSWDMNGEEMGNVATDNAATRDDKYYSISSRLQIPYQTWTTGKTFTCTVKFFNGTGYENHPASIRGPVDSGRNEAATFVKSGKTTMLAYGMIIVKSVIYGIFIIVVIKKQDFRGK